MAPVTTASRRRFNFRYHRENRRLHVWGSNFDSDLGSIKRMIEHGVIPAPLDALIYALTDSTTRILRGRRMDEWLD